MSDLIKPLGGMSTFEEAKLCPKCGKPGEETKSEAAPLGGGIARGTKIVTVYCRTVDCPWENTPWMIQVNPDGSIPPPQDHTGQPKLYRGFNKAEDQKILDQITASLERQQRAETTPGSEIRNPRG